jgi:hypothetical protein
MLAFFSRNGRTARRMQYTPREIITQRRSASYGAQNSAELDRRRGPHRSKLPSSKHFLGAGRPMTRVKNNFRDSGIQIPVPKTMSETLDSGFRTPPTMFLPLVIAIPAPATVRGGRESGFRAFKNCPKRWDSGEEGQLHYFEGSTGLHLASSTCIELSARAGWTRLSRKPMLDCYRSRAHLAAQSPKQRQSMR